MSHDTYAALLNKKLVIPSQKTSYLAIERNYFVGILSRVVSDIYVDESWYVQHSPDVGTAVAEGDFASATDHFIKVGFYEHRMPYEIDVDDEWYLENYPDIADAVKTRVFPSGRAHFYQNGYREGRLPHANFALRTRPT